MSRSRRTLTIVLRVVICGVALLLGSAVYSYLKATKPVPASVDRGDNRPHVSVMQAQRMPVARVWTGYGTARAMDTADVPARVTANVVALGDGVLDGAVVDQGQVLVRLDAGDFERRAEIAAHALEDVKAQLEQIAIEAGKWHRRAELAREAVELARADYDRAAEAQRRDAVKEREVDRARQALITAMRDEVSVEQELEAIPQRRSALDARRLGLEAEVRLAGIDVGRCTIASPLSGLLQSVDVEIGESVTAGTRVARVVSLARVEVPIRLPASAREHVGEGDTVTLTASDETQFQATIARVAPEDDTRTRTMTALVELDAADGALPAPGRFLRAEVRERRAEPRWVLPRRALDDDRVRLVVDGRIRSVPVDVDYQVEREIPEFGLLDTTWVIVDGDALTPGAEVLVNGTRRLLDGLEVITVVADGANP